MTRPRRAWRAAWRAWRPAGPGPRQPREALWRRLGRAGVLWAVGLLGAVRHQALRAPLAPPSEGPAGRPLRILLVRLDGRLGHLLMTTPLLAELRRRCPQAQIDCAVQAHAARVLRAHPARCGLIGVAGWWPFGATGWWRALRALRAARYDVCLDAGSPTEPSARQALFVAWAGARYRLGYAAGPAARSLHGAVPVPRHHRDAWHEVARRLALLDVLPAWASAPNTRPSEATGEGLWPLPSVGPLSAAAGPAMRAFVEGLHGRAYVVINVGARAAAARVSPADGATVANLCQSLGLQPVSCAGSCERRLCEAVRRLSPDVHLAPEASLADLACLFERAAAVISGDTGPTHLAVALGTPTLAIFSHTPWTRFGYAVGPHACIDARTLVSQQWAPQARHFLAALSGPVGGVPAQARPRRPVGQAASRPKPLPSAASPSPFSPGAAAISPPT